MAQQGKIEFSFWYSLAKWHRTVDRQPAAMRTCLKTAGKGNSTYCLQTWTHMSENAQNIAFFTRFVGAESAGLSINYILLLASLLRAIVLQYVISFLAFISYIYIYYTDWWFGTFLHILGIIIPTDELIFFRGVGWNHQPDDKWILVMYNQCILVMYNGWLMED